jgi:hypothetical protein
MYNPKKEIRKVREKIHEWLGKIGDMLDEEEFNEIFEKICNHIDDDNFIDIDVKYYEEIVEGRNIITLQKKLEKEYPKDFQQILAEERRHEYERIKMMREDDYEKL